MITEICHEVKNWFAFDEDKNIGTFVISGGVITPSLDLQSNQYYRIIGSVFNDGVHKYGDASDALTDETFTGAVWFMRVPKEFLDLVDEISTWSTNNATALNSPYQSESFGGYSYSKASGNNGKGYTWKDAFGSRLNRWRKV